MAESPYLDQVAAGFEPVVGYDPVVLPSPVPNIPALGPGNAAMQMFGPIAMQAMGLNTFGNGGMNPYDQMWRQQEYELQMKMMQGAMGLERDQYMRTAAGAAALRGAPFGGQERAQFAAMFDTVAPIAMPLMPAFAPTFDQFAGQYGSPMAMAYGMSTVAPYRFDPITNQMGMNLSTMQFQHAQLYDEMFLHGDMAERHGVRAGDVGMMFGEMGRRGLLPGGDNRREALANLNPTRLGRLAAEQGVDISGGVSNITNQQMSQLMQSDVLRNEVAFFDGDRVKESLKGFSEVISAMRDLMGANGDPDAPLPKIMRNLDAITQGMSSQMPAGKIAETVRMTHQLTQMTGMSMDGAMLMQGHISSRLDAAGLPTVVAPQLLQSNLAFGGALRATGITPGWGMVSADALQQLDANLRVGAFNSETGNRLGAFLRAREAMGGFTGDAETVAQGLISGDSSFANMSDGRFMELMASQGITDGQTRGYLGQRNANQRLSAAYDIQSLVASPDVQGREYNSFLEQNARRYITSSLIAQGMSPEEAKAKAASASGATIDAYVGMSREDYADPARRNAAFGAVLQAELGLDARQAGLMADGLVGEWDTATARGSYRGLENTAVAKTLFDREIDAGADTVMSQAKARERVQAAMAGLGDNSVVRRSIKALQASDGDTEVLDVLRGAVGDIAPESVLKQAGADMQRLATLDTRAQEILQQITDASPEDRRKLLGELDATMKEFVEAKGKVSGILNDAGIPEEDNPLTGKQYNDAASMFNAVIDTRAGLKGNAPEDWGAYWNDPEQGGKFAEQITLATERGADVFNRAMLSSSTTSKHGGELIEQARNFYGGQHELQALADEHASGDVRRLLAGDFDGADSEEVQSRIKNALGKQSGALNFLAGGMNGEGRTAKQKAEALLRLEGKNASGAGAMEKAVGYADKLTPEARAALSKSSKLKAQLDRLASYHGVSSDDVMTAVRGGNSELFNELNEDDRKSGLLRVGNELAGAENVLAAEAKAKGLSAAQAQEGGDYLSRLEAARSRESALYYGDGEALLSEIESLSGMTLEEGDASLKALATQNRPMLNETVSHLRTIRSLTGEQDPRSFVNDVRGMLAYNDPNESEAQRRRIMERYGLTEEQIGQASGAVQGLNQSQMVDVLNAGAGGEAALRRRLGTGSASENPEAINVNFSGSNVTIKIDGDKGQIDGKGRGRRR